MAGLTPCRWAADRR